MKKDILYKQEDMKQEDPKDKEIAEGVLGEVKSVMAFIDAQHSKAALRGPLKRDAYSQTKAAGLWDAGKIIAEYPAIRKHESRLSANVRRMVALIFESASTNFWAKRIFSEKHGVIPVHCQGTTSRSPWPGPGEAPRCRK